MSSYEVGQKVMYRGRFVGPGRWSCRGVVEIIMPGYASPYGIRLENGNFAWATVGQLGSNSDDFVSGV